MVKNPVSGSSNLFDIIKRDIFKVFPYIWYMKTTVNIRDDLFRRAKARAALLGQSFGGFLEDALARALQERDAGERSLDDWAKDLPPVSPKAGQDLEKALRDPNFRTVDSEMWR